MPKKRQATLTLDGPEDQTVTFLADFEQLTLTRTQVGGYQREPNDIQPISPAAAESFWKQLEALAAKGLRYGDVFMLDGSGWKLEAHDGKKAYAASGQISDSGTTGGENEKYGNWPDPVPPASYADIAALFALLKQ